MYISGTIFNLRQRVYQLMQTQSDYDLYWAEFESALSFLQANWYSEIGYLNRIFQKKKQLYHLDDSSSIETFFILLENGDFLITEDSNNLTT